MFSGNKNNNQKIRKIVLIVMVVFLFSFAIQAKPAQAMMTVSDLGQNILQTGKFIWQKLLEKGKDLIKKGGSIALQTAVRKTLNTIAYDMATWAGTGDRGQKPQWVTGDVGTTLANVGDQAAGHFIETFSNRWGIDLCEPQIGVKLKIGLGLVAQKRPSPPDCTFTEMMKNWQEAVKKPDFLKNLANSFDPTTNDLGIAMQLQTNLMEKEELEKANEKLNYTKGESGDYRDPRAVSGKLLGTPGQAAAEKRAAQDAQIQSVGKFTGDALSDAINVFLNQLAITSFQRLMRNLTSSLNDSTSPYTGDFGGLLDENAGPFTAGIKGAKNALREIIEPKFNSRGDYEILAELSMCNEDQFGIGPTNCVIEERLRQAIEAQKTVAEAIADGFLRKDLPFGFTTSGQNPIEPRYNEGIPYRSMLILRKFRIIPVGWEIAAEYVRSHPGVINNAYLGKMIECFSPDDSLEGYEAEWCQGLVDPNWVFKAPKNYCAKEGFGPQIINETTLSLGNDDNGKSLGTKYAITRADNYCADEQSCISEKDDGSCEYFGYCGEEKREWRFDAKSCEPIYNTCQTFVSEDGKSLSLLKNTLSYCSQDQYGCEKYARGVYGIYLSDKKAVDWNKSIDYIYLNKEAAACTQKEEGCHEFIRTKADIGANLIADSGFEGSEIGTTTSNSLLSGKWPISGSATIIDNAPKKSGYVMAIESNSGSAIFYSYDHSAASFSSESVLPKGTVFEPEENYTFSADVYLEAGDEAGLSIGSIGGNSEEVKVSGSGRWERLAITVFNNLQLNANIFSFYVRGSGSVRAYIDNIQFEVGEASEYKDYLSQGVIYEKIIPNYLEEACYRDPIKDDYKLKTDAPAECFNYARKCNREEVGCESYYNATDKTRIAGKVTAKDYCKSECVGYNTYIQKENNFTSPQVKYFIPSTARACGAGAIGCEEFTNLDKLASGGEQKEYFSYLRQCVKPNEPGANCAEFYSWEGNKDKGQQLVKYGLRADAGGDPLITSDDSLECSEVIYNLPQADPSYNPDCREFYNRSGAVSYHLYSRTISCEEDCHPYRMTYKNIKEGATQASCSGSDYNWDAASQTCYYCANNGVWSNEHGACIYKAIPGESVSCKSEFAGCGEYNGSSGSNINTLVNSTFENGEDEWIGNKTIVGETSAISGKNSVYMYDPLYKTLGKLVNKNSVYVFKFVAKGDGADVPLEVRFEDTTGNISSFGQVNIARDKWAIYELSLSGIDHEITDNERIVITRGNNPSNIYIDNIRLTEVKNRYFVIRNSWNTPASCDQDENGNFYPLFTLGCDAYKDRFNIQNYIHNFDQICQESAVGCEAMINTGNYTPRESLTEINGKPVNVPEDWLSYVVYDPKKACNEIDKGCERLGQAYEYADSVLYKDVYLKNNPDEYEKTLCDKDGVGCDRWKTTEGDYYFKNPEEIICEYRQAEGAGQVGWAWFKKKINRCAGIGNICVSDDDCAIGTKCQLEEADNICPTEALKTVGFGGIGNEVKQPSSDGVNNWVGVCPAAHSGCTEYIDPVSEFSTNVIFNYDFAQNIDNNDYADGWNNDLQMQRIKLEGNNLYILTVSGVNSLSISAPTAGNVFYTLQNDNKFSDVTGTVTVNGNSSLVFYLDRTISGELRVDNVLVKNGSKVFLRKAVIDYQVASKIDKKTCNGVADFSDGCVWLNERGFGRDGESQLIGNAWQMYKDVYNNIINNGVNNSNQLVKSRPDRTCNTWLACKSYIRDENGNNVCFDIGACNRLAEDGSCANFSLFEDSKKINNTYNADVATTDLISAENLRNLSGYAKAGSGEFNPYFIKMPNNLYNFGNMEQVGKNAFVPNGDFEFYDEKTKSVSSWMPFSGSEWTTSTSENLFSVISDPVSSQNEAISYPVIGKSFLKYNAQNTSGFPTSEVIYVDPGEEYYLSFYINTLSLKGITNSRARISLISNYGSGNVELSDFVEESKDKDWTLKVKKIQIPAGVDSVNIRLGATNGASGSIYIDDIQISSVLKAKDAGVNAINENDQSGEFYARQSCRLYPKEDALSCDYFDESGIIQKGERGYCLEYDRAPGNPDACLLWWPIDKTSGSALSSGVYGYNDRLPLYYCEAVPPDPYIDASSIQYIVDEYTYLEVNGVRINGTCSDKKDWIGIIDNSKINMGAGGGATLISGDPLTGLLFGGLFDGYYHYFQRGNNDVGSANKFTNCLRTGLPTSVLDGNKIYLKPGKNEIKVGFDADYDFGVSFLLMTGKFYYYNTDLGWTEGMFNVSNQGSQKSTSEVMDITYNGLENHNCELVGVYGSGDDNMDKWDLGIFGSGRLGDNNAERNYIVNEDEDGSNCNIGEAISAKSMTFTIEVDNYPCLKLANVVTRDGRNKAWADRVRQGTTYDAACNHGLPSGQMSDNVYSYFASIAPTGSTVPYDVCSYSVDYQPFGSIIPPSGSLNFLANPSLWSAQMDYSPLFYEFPVKGSGNQPPYQARMGQLHSSQTLPYIFAESYGVWNWDSANKTYVRAPNSENWHGPTNLCPGNERISTSANCAISPEIHNILVNGTPSAEIRSKGFVNLSFNSEIDSEQMPLVSYEVDWGDGNTLSISGAEMRDRPEKTNPHLAFHSYDYWDLKSKKDSLGNKLNMVNCPTVPLGQIGYCTVIPKVKIKDNWGWCSEGRDGVPCPGNGTSYCMNSNRVASSFACDNFNNYNKYCSDNVPGYPICSDGWYELGGSIKVYEQ